MPDLHPDIPEPVVLLQRSTTNPLPLCFYGCQMQNGKNDRKTGKIANKPERRKRFIRRLPEMCFDPVETVKSRFPFLVFQHNAAWQY